MKYVFDTCHISILQKRVGTEYTTLTTRMASVPPNDLAFSIVSLHEQFLGCQTFLARSRTSADLMRGYTLLSEVLAAFARAQILEFDSVAGSTFDGLVRLKIRVSTMDLRIAAIALSQGLILLTRNVRDFSKVPGLITEDWTI